MSGWIAISRDLFAHDFFAREPMSEREAWVWMIARAAWKDTRHRVGGDVVNVARGSFFCTLRELQQAWGWGSDKRVRTFLRRLQNERMADATTTAQKTQITICNYEQYQDIGRTKDAAANENGRSRDALKEQVNQEPREEEKREAKASPKKAPSGSRLNADWFLPRTWGDWALAEGADREAVKREADRFRDYWIAVAGAKGRKADWEATWRNWIRKHLADQAKEQGNGNSKGERRLQSWLAGSAVAPRVDSWPDTDAPKPLLARG